MEVYGRSVAVNQVWVERALQYAELGELAAAVNAPGNDIFVSRDAAAEERRLHAALHAFELRFRQVRGEIEGHAPEEEAAPILEQLDAVGSAVRRMAAEAGRIFVDFEAHRPARAAERMATTDRTHAHVIAALGDLRRATSRMQRRNFADQMEVAQDLASFEIAVAALVLLMVAAATVYGHRLARKMQDDARRIAATNRMLQAEMALRQQALRALEETNHRLQALIGHTLEAEEAQRRHIAHELHEEVAQMVASVRLRLETLPSAPPGDLQPRVAEAGTIAKRALQRLQDLARSLIPGGMEDLGLEVVLPVRLREWTRDSGLAVRFSQQLETARCCPRAETAAYRIAEAAVTNVLEHARAGDLRVALRQDADRLHLEVEDDGVGFDVAQARREGSAGLGLGLMEQRAGALGGSLEIVSEPGHGTRIRAALPCTRE
jgi:signal transduction histidine kinase